ncbi:MAG: DinB family protein [Actinomycetota bacterium]|nr:DinB family protein [Actinomycetota bacterium]
MHTAELLVDAFARVRDVVGAAVDGLTPGQLTWRVHAESNTIGWLVWHLTRIQDDHVGSAYRSEQVWAEGWADRFALPFDESATGYGQSPQEVAAVRVDADLLAGYHDAVHDRTVELLRGITDADLDRVVDEGWDPPVTLGMRLVSVISDDLQHAGQAAYVRGLVQQSRY